MALFHTYSTNGNLGLWVYSQNILTLYLNGLCHLRQICTNIYKWNPALWFYLKPIQPPEFSGYGGYVTQTYTLFKLDNNLFTLTPMAYELLLL